MGFQAAIRLADFDLIGNAGLNAPLYIYVSRWFGRRRGSALALISSGSYIAGAVWPTIFERAIAVYGWRTSMIAYAALEVVVISDGSVDRTTEVAAEHGAHVIRLPFNLGIGGAVQTGFRYAWEHGYEVAVRCDGDGQHDPAELPKVLAPVLLMAPALVVPSPQAMLAV